MDTGRLSLNIHLQLVISWPVEMTGGGVSTPGLV